MGALVPSATAIVWDWLNGALRGRPGPREETVAFIPALLPDQGTQQNKTALSCSSAPALGHPETA